VAQNPAAPWVLKQRRGRGRWTLVHESLSAPLWRGHGPRSSIRHSPETRCRSLGSGRHHVVDHVCSLGSASAHPPFHLRAADLGGATIGR
jgi:hypothetical protein